MSGIDQQKIKEYAPYVFLCKNDQKDNCYDLFVLVPIYEGQTLVPLSVLYLKKVIFKLEEDTTLLLFSINGDKEKEGAAMTFEPFHIKLSPGDHFSDFQDSPTAPNFPLIVSVLTNFDLDLDATILLYKDKEEAYVEPIGAIANNAPYAYLEVDENEKYTPSVVLPSKNSFLKINGTNSTYGTIRENNQERMKFEIELSLPGNHRERFSFFHEEISSEMERSMKNEIYEIYAIHSSLDKTIADGKKTVKIRSKNADTAPLRMFIFKFLENKLSFGED